MIDFIKTAYTRKVEAEGDAGLPHVHWLDDIFAASAVGAIMMIALVTL